VVSGNNVETQDLDMSKPLSIMPGSCGDVQLTPTVQSDSTTAPLDYAVGFQAGLSNGSKESVLGYQWDFDGDGTVDQVTESPSTTHQYGSTGTYDASVSLLTRSGPSKTVSLPVRVVQSGEPAISVTGIENGTAEANRPSPVTVSLANRGGSAGSIDLEMRADGEVVGSRTVEVGANAERTVTVNATFPETGSYAVSVGNSRGTVTVQESSSALVVNRVTVDDERVAIGQMVTVTADVENVGSEGDEFTVQLRVSGEVVESQTVEVPAGETRSVEFTIPGNNPGTYNLSVGSASTQVVVDPDETTAPPPGSGVSDLGLPGLPTLAALLAALVLLGIGVYRYRRT
jgi:hypothetical protein